MSMDRELILLYVKTYSVDMEGFIPDLSEGCETYRDLRDAVEDFAADYICDRERPRRYVPEIREAAKRIAALYA